MALPTFQKGDRVTFKESPEVVEGTDGSELRHPGVPHVREIGRGVADEGREELLVRRRKRDLLDDDVNARIAPLELGDEARHELAFAAEGPELEVFSLIVRSRRAAGDQEEEKKGKC